MQTEYGRDLQDDEQPIRDALQARPGKPLKIRLQPAVFWPGVGRGQYKVWRDVIWTVECDTAEEAFALRDALRAFFQAVGVKGPVPVRALLRGERKEEAIA
jgi:hypothetical protein